MKDMLYYMQGKPSYCEKLTKLNTRDSAKLNKLDFDFWFSWHCFRAIKKEDNGIIYLLLQCRASRPQIQNLVSFSSPNRIHPVNGDGRSHIKAWTYGLGPAAVAAHTVKLDRVTFSTIPPHDFSAYYITLPISWFLITALRQWKLYAF